jgi:hypothetical protein
MGQVALATTRARSLRCSFYPVECGHIICERDRHSRYPYCWYICCVCEL